MGAMDDCITGNPRIIMRSGNRLQSGRDDILHVGSELFMTRM